MKLSKTEETLMLHLWNMKEAFMKDLIIAYPEPKPATTTIATLLKRIRDKGFIDYKVVNGARKYFPIVQKNDFISGRFKGLMQHYFENSPTQFASFFTKSTEMTKEQLEELKSIIDSEIEKKK